MVQFIVTSRGLCRIDKESDLLVFYKQGPLFVIGLHLSYDFVVV